MEILTTWQWQIIKAEVDKGNGADPQIQLKQEEMDAAFSDPSSMGQITPGMDND